VQVLTLAAGQCVPWHYHPEICNWARSNDDRSWPREERSKTGNPVHSLVARLKAEMRRLRTFDPR
jgi:hypothetical protein